MLIMSGEEAPTQQQEEPEQQVKQAEEPQEPKPEPETPAAVKQQEEEKKVEEEKTLSSRALVLTGYGGYEKIKLQVKSMKAPQLRSGEVLVRVKACGLNFAELLGKQGLYELLPAPPVVMGMEGSGVVEAVAEDVKDRKVSRCSLSYIHSKSSSGLQLPRYSEVCYPLVVCTL